MTDEEIKKLKLRFQGHMAMEHEHTITHSTTVKGVFVGQCVHTPYKNGEPDKRKKPYTHYKVGSELYKTNEEFLEALRKL